MANLPFHPFITHTVLLSLFLGSSFSGSVRGVEVTLTTMLWFF